MNKILLGLIVIIVGWTLIMLSLKGLTWMWKRGARTAANKALAGEKILRITSDASFLGADFPGPNLPPRTSGVLAVTDKRIYFMPWFPRKSLSLPHDWIKEVQLKASYGNFSTSVPCMVFTGGYTKDPSGTIAWMVHDPREWIDAINSALR
jgi:hypothetical protein